MAGMYRLSAGMAHLRRAAVLHPCQPSHSIRGARVNGRMHSTTSPEQNSQLQGKDHKHGDEHKNGHHDDHSGFHAAEHQVTHRAIEKGSFKLLESMAERLTSKQLVQKLGQKVLTSAGEHAVNKAGMKAAEHAAEKMTERLGERLMERIVDRTGERIGERAAERLAERAGERMGERIAERVAERAGERMGERVVERVAERAGERMGERIAERVAEHTGERVGERIAERVAERAGSRALKDASVRAGGHAAVQVVERVAERAGAGPANHAVSHGALVVSGAHAAASTASRAPALFDAAVEKMLGSRVVRRVLTPQLLTRVGRGALVALPAIGALFVAHLAHQDYIRLQQERAAQNIHAAVGFGIAFVCDMADVLAHILIVFGLAHQHFHVGPNIPHAILHATEGAGLFIAVVSTIAAAAAEVLSMRRAAGTAHMVAKAVVSHTIVHNNDHKGDKSIQNSNGVGSSSDMTAEPQQASHAEQQEQTKLH